MLGSASMILMLLLCNTFVDICPPSGRKYYMRDEAEDAVRYEEITAQEYNRIRAAPRRWRRYLFVEYSFASHEKSENPWWMWSAHRYSKHAPREHFWLSKPGAGWCFIDVSQALVKNHIITMFGPGNLKFFTNNFAMELAFGRDARLLLPPEQCLSEKKMSMYNVSIVKRASLGFDLWEMPPGDLELLEGEDIQAIARNLSIILEFLFSGTVLRLELEKYMDSNDRAGHSLIELLYDYEIGGRKPGADGVALRKMASLLSVNDERLQRSEYRWMAETIVLLLNTVKSEALWRTEYRMSRPSGLGSLMEVGATRRMDCPGRRAMEGMKSEKCDILDLNIDPERDFCHEIRVLRIDDASIVRYKAGKNTTISAIRKELRALGYGGEAMLLAIFDSDNEEVERIEDAFLEDISGDLHCYFCKPEDVLSHAWVDVLFNAQIRPFPFKFFISRRSLESRGYRRVVMDKIRACMPLGHEFRCLEIEEEIRNVLCERVPYRAKKNGEKKGDARHVSVIMDFKFGREYIGESTAPEFYASEIRKGLARLPLHRSLAGLLEQNKGPKKVNKLHKTALLNRHVDEERWNFSVGKELVASISVSSPILLDKHGPQHLLGIEDGIRFGVRRHEVRSLLYYNADRAKYELYIFRNGRWYLGDEEQRPRFLIHEHPMLVLLREAD
jgi:hypothetical protein